MVTSVVLVLVLALNCQLISSARFEFEEYTRVATAFDGTPCLTGCSQIDYQCVVDWAGTKKGCQTFGPAPIFFTTQYYTKTKHCISNCGYFGYPQEWCITSKELQWDVCSSYVRNSKNVESKSVTGLDCRSKCATDSGHWYHWCLTSTAWDYCALAALPRIPVLPEDYNIGLTNKGKCDVFLQLVSRGQIFNEPVGIKSSIRDDLLLSIAGGIETTGAHYLSSSMTSVLQYTMVDAGGANLPAVVRARVTRNTPFINTSSAGISERIANKIRQQMNVFNGDVELMHIIPPTVGGLDEEYNIVPMSSDTSRAWNELHNAILRWARDTGGSVDILVVVFYKNDNSFVPRGFGISLQFKNSDYSHFIACQDVIYWSQL